MLNIKKILCYMFAAIVVLLSAFAISGTAYAAMSEAEVKTSKKMLPIPKGVNLQPCKKSIWVIQVVGIAWWSAK